MTLSLAQLPPPVVLEHNESLHRILLPPLATFLTSLTKQEHLVKLNEILERFRTPKSYHRIDVREVESSELPVNSPLDYEFGERTARAAAADREKGEPIILEPGVRHEDWLTTNQELADGLVVDHAAEQGGPPSGPDDQGTPISNGINGTAEPSDISPAQAALPMPSSLPVEAAAGLPLPSPPQAFSPASAIPKRRVRELRLDLRSLDAAALFTLEAWRREILGMDKLDMEHPDSVWYKDPTPTPPPSPPPEPKRKPGWPRQSTGRRPGRPRKRPLTPSAEPEVVELDRAEYDSLAQALGQTESQPDLSPAEEPAVEDTTLHQAMAKLDESQHGNPAETQVEQTHDEADGHDTSIVPEADFPPAANGESGEILPPVSEQVYVEEGESERSLSPDVILHDLYDEDIEADPDFVPPEEPSPKKAKTRQSDQDVVKPKKNGQTGKRLARKSFPSRLNEESGVSPTANSDIGLPDYAHGIDDAQGIEPKKRRRRTVAVFVELPARRRSSSRQVSVLESSPQFIASPLKRVRFSPPEEPAIELYHPELNESFEDNEDEWGEFREI